MIRSLCIFLVTAAAPLYCQTLSIQGSVVDPSSRPVPNAIVRCGTERALSDSQGRFTLNSASPCDASVESEGFELAKVLLNPGTPARIQLTIARAGDRVVVSATRTPTSLEESGVSATIFTRRDLNARQFPAVPDLLRDSPGVTIAASGRPGAITSIFIRGGASTATLFLLDGIPLNEPGGQINVANLSTAGLDRIEFVRGAESALFGAEAASGVVQLFTARGDPESTRPHGSVSYERGSFQTDRWTANLTGGLLHRIDYSLTADQFHTVNMFPNDFFRNTTGSANIGFHLSDATQIRAIYREFDAVAGNPGQVGFGAFNSNAYGGDRDSALSVRADDARGTRFVQRLAFTYSRLRNLFADTGADAPFPIAALVQRVTSPRPSVYLVRTVPATLSAAEVPAGLTLANTTVYDFASSFSSIDHRTSVDYQGTWTHPGGALVFGYRYERQAGVISNNDIDRQNNGAFIHEQWSFGRRLFLTGGARIENSSAFGSRFVPRGSATFQVLPSTYVRVSAGRGFTEPSLLENFANEPYYVGNRTLKPEKTTMFDAGIVHELLQRRVRLEATYFRNSYQDLIVFDSAKFPSTWSNIDRSQARGLETTASVRLWRNVQLSANYTRLSTRITRTNSTNPYTGVGQELPRRPRDSGSATLSFTPRRWSLLIGGRALGERQDSDFLFGITRNPGYGSMFVSGSFEITRHIVPFVRMDNVFNEHYGEVLGYTALNRAATGGVRLTW